MNKFVIKVSAVLASKKFFYALVALFVLQAAWIALTGRYPMAFDEDFHVGIIKLYAHQWSPFFAHQPSGGGMYGAVTRDPSYLYHWIMSFPYRLTDGLFHSDFINVLMLRFFSVAFVAASLVIFRRVLAYAKASPALINTVFLFFVLTPLMPFEAAQINYDNLLIPLCGLALLGTISFLRQLRVDKRFHTGVLLATLATCMLASLVKYEFLPIFLVLGLCLLAGMIASWRRQSWRWRELWRHVAKGFMRLHVAARIALVAVFLLALGLFLQMDIGNVVRYGTPAPECDQILSVQQCHSYGAWERNYQYALHNHGTDKNPLPFTRHWAYAYLYSFYFMVNGIYSGFHVEPPLPVIFVTSVILALAGLLLCVVYGRWLWRDRVLRLFIIVVLAYVATLWLQNYSDHVHLGRDVAEQGRYVLPLILPAYLVVASAFARLLRSRPTLKVLLAVVAFLLFLQGAGILTYITRTDWSWWWQNNPLAWQLNTHAQKIIRPLLIGS